MEIYGNPCAWVARVLCIEFFLIIGTVYPDTRPVLELPWYLYNTNQCRERIVVETGKFCDKTIIFGIYYIPM